MRLSIARRVGAVLTGALGALLLLSQPSLLAQDAPPTATASGVPEAPPAADLREPAILVRVLDAEGAPAVGVEVFSEAMGSRAGPVFAGVADAAGRLRIVMGPIESRGAQFRLDRVPPGRYRVRVLAQLRGASAEGRPGRFETVNMHAVSVLVPEGRAVMVHMRESVSSTPADRSKLPLRIVIRGLAPRDESPRFVELSDGLHDAHHGLIESGVAPFSAPRGEYRARLSFAPREGEGHFVAHADVDFRSAEEVLLVLPPGRGGLVVHAKIEGVIFSGFDVEVRLITDTPNGRTVSALRVGVIAELNPDTRAARFPYLPAGRYRVRIAGFREAVVEVTDGGVTEHVLVRERP